MKNEANPTISVIIPARNEEACLASCLESLVAQTGVDFEIIVVDDASTDGTAEIARSVASTTRKGTAPALPQHEHFENGGFSPQVILVSAPPLPRHWTGKNNAMSAGAKIAKGKWLLFTDADTIHKPGSLARAVAEAEQHGAALLSYSPEQQVRTLCERSVMPVIFAELAATYPPKKVSDPRSPIAAANGQYLLISREVYDAVGGHTKSAESLLDDVAMARLVKSSGRKILFRYGGDAVQTRMYRNWSQMKEGWTKNLALLFPRPRALGFFRGVEFALIVGNIIAAIVAVLLLHHSDVAVATGLLASMLLISFFLRIRQAHFSAMSNLLATGGLAVFSYLLFRSAKLHRNAAVTWKGRKYGNLPDRPRVLPAHNKESVPE